MIVVLSVIAGIKVLLKKEFWYSKFFWLLLFAKNKLSVCLSVTSAFVCIDWRLCLQNATCWVLDIVKSLKENKVDHEIRGL